MRKVEFVLSSIVSAALIISWSSHYENPYLFLQAVHDYSMTPFVISLLLAALLPAMQITFAMGLLIIPTVRQACFCICASMFIIFTFAQGIAYFRGLDIACGCLGGYATGTISLLTISVPLTLSILSLVGVWVSRVAAHRHSSESDHVAIQ